MDGRLLRTAIVRELNGYDEEVLAKADSRKTSEYLLKIVELACVSIDGEKLSPLITDHLLLGDRDAIVLGIRKATYGNIVTYENVECPQCSKRFDVDVDLDTDVKIKKLEDPKEDRVFELALHSGGTAVIRYATVGDQDAIKDAPIQGVNTALLARTLVSINGKAINMQADPAEDIILRMNMRDRQTLIKEMYENQPGPDLTSIEIECPSGCGYKDVLGVTLFDLFRV